MKKVLLLLIVLISAESGVLAQKTRPLYKNNAENESQKTQNKTIASPSISDDEIKIRVEHVNNMMVVTMNEWEAPIKELKKYLEAIPIEKVVELKGIFESFKNKEVESEELIKSEYTLKVFFTDFIEGNGLVDVLNEASNQLEQMQQNAAYYGNSDNLKRLLMHRWENLRYICDIYSVLKSGSELSELKSLYAKNYEQLSIYFELKEKEYVKTPIHKKYKNSVVIAYQPIKYGSEIESSFLSDVVLDGAHSGLYFMLYNVATNGEFLKSSTNVKNQFLAAQLQIGDDVGDPIFIGCQPFFDEAYDLSDTEETQAYLSLPLIPSTENYKRDKWLDPTYFRFIQCLLSLESGKKHTAKVLFKFPYSDHQFEREFSITITEAGKAKMKEVLDAIQKELLAEVKMKSPGAMHAEKYTQLIKNQGIRQGFDIKKVVVTGNSYAVYKDSKFPYDIKNRACKAQIAYSKGDKCYIRTIYLVQEYQGGGSYGSTTVNFDWGADEQEILCENI